MCLSAGSFWVDIENQEEKNRAFMQRPRWADAFDGSSGQTTPVSAVAPTHYSWATRTPTPPQTPRGDPILVLPHPWNRWAEFWAWALMQRELEPWQVGAMAVCLSGIWFHTLPTPLIEHLQHVLVWHLPLFARGPRWLWETLFNTRFI